MSSVPKRFDEKRKGAHQSRQKSADYVNPLNLSPRSDNHEFVSTPYLPPISSNSIYNETVTSPTSLSSTSPSTVRIQLWEPSVPRSSCSHYKPWTIGATEDGYPLHVSPATNSPTPSDANETVMRDISPLRHPRPLNYPNNIETLMQPVSRYQIVLFKDTTMVVYNLDNRRIEARALSKVEKDTIRAHRMSHCPMCGQVIDLSRFSFQAQSYFRILQDLYRARYSPTNTQSSDINYSEQYSSSNFMFSSRHRGLSEYHSTLSLPSNAADQGNPFIELSPEVLEGETTSIFSETSNEKVSTPKNLSKGLFLTGYYQNFFREIRRLGSGSFGQVFLCHHLLDDVYLGEYAVKKVPVGDDKAWLQKMLREVKIRERLHNSNIVEYKHSWLEMYRTATNLPIIPWLFVLMEFCNGGDLDSFLSSNRFTAPMSVTVSTAIPIPAQDEGLLPMKESQIWKLFFDIASGLNQLHHSGILHRDLKPQNILLQCTIDTLTNQPTTSALLADFGTSELFSERSRHARRHGFTGTVEFTAPELLETDETGAFRDDYDEKSDVWSLGVVLYVLAFGFVPYCNADPTNVRLKILGHSDPRSLIPSTPERSADLVLLIEALLQRDPDSRPSIDAVLAHRRIFKRFTDSEEMAEAGREISYLLPFFRAQRVSSIPRSRHPTKGTNRNDHHLALLRPSDSIQCCDSIGTHSKPQI